MKTTGLHHVTAIASDPQRNLDFYAGALGLRLVKRTVNFDDPGSYHFYFGDTAGSPGTIITFFPWPHARRGRRGSGEVESTAYAIPAASTSYWLQRLKEHGAAAKTIRNDFDGEVIRVEDPDGTLIELVPTDAPVVTQPWSAVPEEYAIRGFHGVTALLHDTAPTAGVLTSLLGYQRVEEKNGRIRLQAPGSSREPGRYVDLIPDPDAPLGQMGAGTVHHIAFRAANDEAQAGIRKELADHGIHASPVMDRSYFHSVYFREPGGVLFEIATDNPGFATDESREELGQNLRLPSWMEKSRNRIAEILPPITLPTH